MKRIGFLGGTFNPVHIGHLAAAQAAKEALRLERVIFVPSHLPPHKTSRGVVAARHRFQMVRLATRGNPDLKVSDYEVRKRGKTYTIDTLEHFQKQFPSSTAFFFIIGEDMLDGLQKWRQIGDILKLVRFAVVGRPGYQKRKPKIPCRPVSMPGIDISSTDLRRRMRQGKTVKYLIPGSVEDYIRRHGLYGSKKLS